MIPERTQTTAATPTGPHALDPQQISGLNDMDAESFRAAAHAAVDIMADYLEGLGGRDVMPQIEPGSLRPLFPASPPEEPESMTAILADYRRLFEPNVTHWQHPRFLAYFASSASGPGIIGEMLTAVLNSNSMLWRTSPAGTELEQVVVDWMRQAVGLPADFDGLITDTASTSSLLALAAARQAAGIDAAAMGLPGRDDVPQSARLRLRGGSLVDRQGLHDARARPGRADEDPDERPLRAAHRCPRGGDSRRPGGRYPAHRPGRHHRHDVDHLQRSDGADGEDRPARRDVAPRRCRLRRRRGRHPGAARAVRGLGGGRLHRHEPAQVVVRAGRRLDPADAADAGPARRLQPRAGILADARSPGADPRLQRVHAHPGPAAAGAQDMDAPALLRAGGSAPARRPSPRNGRAAGGLGRRRPGLRAHGTRPVLYRLPAVPAGGTGGTRGRARRRASGSTT